MVIVESELAQLQLNTEEELRSISTRRQELKELLGQIASIRMTSRTEIIPTVPSVPAVMEEDGVTIKTPAIPETPETSIQVFDVQPIDRNLNAPMKDARRQGIYDSAVAKKASLGF